MNEGINRYITNVYSALTHKATYRISGNYSESEKGLLEKICERPEFKYLVKGVTFHIDDLSKPFFVSIEGVINISRVLLENISAAAVFIRYALELAMCDRMRAHKNESVERVLIALHSCHVALSYHEMQTEREKITAARDFPDWLKELIAEIRQVEQSEFSVEKIIHLLDNKINYLLDFHEGLDEISEAERDQLAKEISGCAARMLPLAFPTERLLTIGGDTRLHVDSHTGLNLYGCSPRPRPWAITFSSCTSSSISDHAYLRAEKLRQRILASDLDFEQESCVIVEAERIRHTIKEVLGISDVTDTEVILTPSGTDGELYALNFVASTTGKPVRNILVAPNEVGSGTLKAARGQHFDQHSPIGGEVAPGETVKGFDSQKIALTCLDVRDDDGNVIDDETFNSILHQTIQSAVGGGEVVLLHLLDCSKTGLGAPDYEIVIKLKQEFKESLFIVADTAQMRIATDAIRQYIENDFMLLITGSKFYTGPPFSGGLIMPPSLSRDVDKLSSLPQGLVSYSSQYDFPRRWLRLTNVLQQRPNYGLLLRWDAALWEMYAFYAVPDKVKYRIIKEFGLSLIRHIESNDDLDLVQAPSRTRVKERNEQIWDELPSIFTFIIKRSADGDKDKVPLTYDEARNAYHWLNMDITAYLPGDMSEEEKKLASKRCHIGQPVRINREKDEWVAALRLAAGARLVSGVTFDLGLGVNLEERLKVEMDDSVAVLRKLSLIINHWDLLSGMDINTGVTKHMDLYYF